jgi:hypothetical protein
MNEKSRKGATMATKRNNRHDHRLNNKMTTSEIMVCYLAVLVLAGYIAGKGIDAPAVWGFLGVAIGILFGKVKK